MIDWFLAAFRHESIEYVLFATSFVSATLLPGGSEVVLAGAVAASPSKFLWLTAVATAGNTLGSMTSYLIGRFIPQTTKEGRAIAWFRKYGIWVAFFCWLPVAGDAIAVAAGWLRFPWLPTGLLIAAGKCARYLAVGWAALKAADFVAK